MTKGFDRAGDAVTTDAHTQDPPALYQTVLHVEQDGRTAEHFMN
ncbi:MAG TPA: hypothetical protein VL752_06415 [Acidisoma sp.]|jgi:hypothetical protein|nr:hypothetical protein [Acidisoma sp.]HTI00565.1 hypothetical protein [Acidisoma sp.]